MIFTEFAITMPDDIYGIVKSIYKENEFHAQGPYVTTHIFDEEKSVRWNREEVERRNKERADAQRRCREHISKSLRNLDEAVAQFIVSQQCRGSKITIEVARQIVLFCQHHWEDDWWNYIYSVENFVDNILK